MEDLTSLVLDIWRTACCNLEIGTAIERTVPLLAPCLPHRLLLVRRLERRQPGLVSVAAAGEETDSLPNLPIHTPCSAADLGHLIEWIGSGGILTGEAAELPGRLPGILPQGLEGTVMVGGLRQGTEPAGVLIVKSTQGAALYPWHERVFAALLEPLAVALENDRRLRELHTLREAVEADNRSLRSRLGRQDISECIVGAETGLREVVAQVDLVARSDVPALLLGETGSGKEVVARAIHERSSRASGPFLRVNCGAIPPELIDSQLFGHEKGSFTGAVADRKGWFERAHGGTLFLDEIGELPAAAQVRLLRILQDGSYERVGGQKQYQVDVRIVAATHQDLKQMVAKGEFRDDLWYRIATFPIVIPPLRQRTEDIPALAAHFAMRAARRLGNPPQAPTAEDNRLLSAYDWPGNIRELSAVIERAAILGAGRRLEIARALGAGLGPLSSSPVSETTPPRIGAQPLLTLDEATARHIEAALARTGGRIEGPFGAASLLAVNPHTLRGRMRRLGIDWRRFRGKSREIADQNGEFASSYNGKNRMDR